ncbi:MAG: hypothetical protein U9P14_10805, partial [Gemmatimonadota bacterium]|nr:hypothetical protein [Gemmatimonadota bacterium]
IIEHQHIVDNDFGGVALELGLITRQTLEALVDEQRKRHLRLGEVLIKLDAVSRGDLKTELVSFDEIREYGLPEEAAQDESFRVNPALGFFDLFSKVLPRMTRGLFLPGGFYPTISSSPGNYRISQQVRGDIRAVAVFIMSPEMFSLLGSSILKCGENGDCSCNKKDFELVVKNMFSIIMRLFISQQEKFGLKLEMKGNPKRIQEKTLLRYRKQSRRSSCIDMFLISPPDPEGDLLEFNVCIYFD